MSCHDPKTIGIFGAGTMGQGIAQCFLTTGNHYVILFDNNTEALEKALENIKKNIQKACEKKMINAKPETLLSRLSIAPALSGNIENNRELLWIFEKLDFAIEAIYENLEAKKEIFQMLEKHTRPEVILASNTSSILIKQIASLAQKPEKICGMHFMNPAPLIDLVEIIQAENTSDETIATTITLTQEIGKIPFVVKDSPGFVLNRVLIPMINEAALILENKIAACPKDIDLIMTLGAKLPIGPLALADLIGIDIVLAIMEKLEKELGDKYKPAEILKKMVTEGKLGKKTKKGFYLY